MPYFYCFDRQEAKVRSLEAHDGGMSQDYCIDEQNYFFVVFEAGLRSSAPRFVRLFISIKHSILAHSEKSISQKIRIGNV